MAYNITDSIERYYAPYILGTQHYYPDGGRPSERHWRVSDYCWKLICHAMIIVRDRAIEQHRYLETLTYHSQEPSIEASLLALDEHPAALAKVAQQIRAVTGKDGFAILSFARSHVSCSIKKRDQARRRARKEAQEALV